MLIKIDTRETDWMTECVTRSCVGGADVTLKSETLPIGDASRTRAIEIFPYFSSQLSKKKDNNKADAILIASFFYETYKKEE